MITGYNYMDFQEPGHRVLRAPSTAFPPSAFSLPCLFSRCFQFWADPETTTRTWDTRREVQLPYAILFPPSDVRPVLLIIYVYIPDQTVVPTSCGSGLLSKTPL